MVITSQDNRNSILSAIAGLESPSTTLQSQITTLSNLQITLDKMGIPNESEKKARLEAQKETLSRICLLNNPDFKQKYLKLEEIMGKIDAANQALQYDKTDDDWLDKQILLYKYSKSIRKWMDRVSELSSRADKIEKLLSDTTVFLTGSADVTKSNVLEFFLDKDYDYERLSDSIILNKDKFFAFKNITTTGLPLATTSMYYNDSLFFLDFLNDVKKTLSMFNSETEYETDLPSIIEIIKNSSTSISNTYDALRKQKKESPINTSDDKRLCFDMSDALTEYNNYDFDLLNSSLETVVNSCMMNIAPATCCYFKSSDYDNLDDATLVKINNNTVTLTALAGYVYNSATISDFRSQVNSILNETITNNNNTEIDNLMTRHNKYVSGLYKNGDLKTCLYKLFDDHSVVEYKNADIKLKSVLSQM